MDEEKIRRNNVDIITEYEKVSNRSNHYHRRKVNKSCHVMLCYVMYNVVNKINSYVITCRKRNMY